MATKKKKFSPKPEDSTTITHPNAALSTQPNEALSTQPDGHGKTPAIAEPAQKSAETLLIQAQAAIEYLMKETKWFQNIVRLKLQGDRNADFPDEVLAEIRRANGVRSVDQKVEDLRKAYGAS